MVTGRDYLAHLAGHVGNEKVRSRVLEHWILENSGEVGKQREAIEVVPLPRWSIPKNAISFVFGQITQHHLISILFFLVLSMLLTGIKISSMSLSDFLYVWQDFIILKVSPTTINFQFHPFILLLILISSGLIFIALL